MSNLYTPVQQINYGSIVRQHVRSRPEQLAVVDGDVRLFQSP